MMQAEVTIVSVIILYSHSCRLLSIVGLLGVIGASLAAYATNTNNLYNSLNTCVNDIGDDISCVETVRDGLQQMSDYIQDVSRLRAQHHKFVLLQ